ncbi:MAG: ATP-binding protein, partial [Acidimicrobiia bacterium]
MRSTIASSLEASIPAIAQRRSFYERIVLADLDAARPQAVVDRLGEHDRFGSAGIDASSEDAVVDLIVDVRAVGVL